MPIVTPRRLDATMGRAIRSITRVSAAYAARDVPIDRRASRASGVAERVVVVVILRGSCHVRAEASSRRRVSRSDYSYCADRPGFVPSSVQFETRSGGLRCGAHPHARPLESARTSFASRAHASSHERIPRAPRPSAVATGARARSPTDLVARHTEGRKRNDAAQEDRPLPRLRRRHARQVPGGARGGR